MSSKLQDGPVPMSLSTTDGRLVVKFVWSNDRFVHQIFVDGQTAEAASSVDRDGEEDWPSSPPMQQLSAEWIDDRPVILGVGSAGRSHWSVVVQTIETNEGQALKFEWACRHKIAPTFLGTTYAHTAAVQVMAAGDATLVRPDDNALTIVPAKASDSGTDCWSYVVTSV